VLLYILIGLQVSTRLWLHYEVRSLSWRRAAPQAAFPGERMTVEIELHNHGLLPIPWVALHESLPPALHTPPMVREVVSLAPRERRVIRYTLSGRRRGYYRLGPLMLQTGDILGLGERPLGSDERSALTIYPRIMRLAELGLPAALPYGTLAASRRLFDDPARPSGVRPYQPADGVRRIDWKTTAHAGQALVRRYQPAIALETLVALAFTHGEYGSRFAYDAMERSLTAAASILAHLAGLRQAFGLCASGRDPAGDGPAGTIRVGAGRSHLMATLGLLGRLEAASEGSILAELRQASASLGWGSTVIIITGQPVAELLPDAIALRRRGLHVALALAEATVDDLGLARRYGIAAFAINREGRPEL
jgi:uncharacterized protein (DUF58 family)